MAAVKLLNSHREYLHTLVDELVKCPAEEVAAEKAYAKAAPLVRAVVEAKFPPKDMKLLAKYDCAETDECIRLQLTAGGIEQFSFRDDAKLPMRPNAHGCGRHIYAADEKTSEAVGAHLLAAAAFKKALKIKHDDYGALINHSATLEQVEAVWPAASALRPRIARSLPVVLSDEVVARIKADQPPMKRAA